MKKPTEVKKPRNSVEELKLLVYGGPGSGKTFFAGTATQDRTTFGKVLLLCVDPGDLTLDHPEINPENVDVTRISTISELEDWLNWLDTENRKTKEYGTVVVEGVADICELAMLEALDLAKKNDSKRDRYLPTIELWNKVQIIARNTVRHYRDLPMHVIFTSFDMERKDEKSGGFFIRPSVVGKLVNELGGYFDIILYITVGPPAKPGEHAPRIFRMQPDANIQAKDRSRRIGITQENLTLPILVHLIKTNEEREPAPVVDATLRIKKFAAK